MEFLLGTKITCNNLNFWKLEMNPADCTVSILVQDQYIPNTDSLKMHVLFVTAEERCDCAAEVKLLLHFVAVLAVCMCAVLLLCVVGNLCNKL